MNRIPLRKGRKPSEFDYRASDALIEAIVKKGNDANCIKQVEPNVCFPQTLLSWQVNRVLKAIELIHEEWKKDESLHKPN